MKALIVVQGCQFLSPLQSVVCGTVGNGLNPLVYFLFQTKYLLATPFPLA